MGQGVVRAIAVLTSVQVLLMEACFAFLESAWLTALLPSRTLGSLEERAYMIFHPRPNTQGSMGPCRLLLFHLNVPLETQMRLGDPICEPWERK